MYFILLNTNLKSQTASLLSLVNKTTYSTNENLRNVRIGSSIEITCVFAKGISKKVRFYSCGDNVFITFVGTGVLEPFQKRSFVL
jgi:hypothetical protein